MCMSWKCIEMFCMIQATITFSLMFKRQASASLVWIIKPQTARCGWDEKNEARTHTCSSCDHLLWGENAHYTRHWPLPILLVSASIINEIDFQYQKGQKLKCHKSGCPLASGFKHKFAERDLIKCTDGFMGLWY